MTGAPRRRAVGADTRAAFGVSSRSSQVVVLPVGFPVDLGAPVGYGVTNIEKRHSIIDTFRSFVHQPSGLGMAPSDFAEERHDTRTRILDAADRLFRHYGYSKTTVADLARDLGMSPANVYRFFASKQEIVQAICHRLLAQRHARNLAVVAGEGTATERLKRFLIENHMVNLEELALNPKYYEIVEVAIAEEWVTIQDYLESMADAIERIIADGIASGEFPAQPNLRRTAVCVRQSYASLIHPTLLRQCRDDRDLAGPEELAEFVIRALRAPTMP